MCSCREKDKGERGVQLGREREWGGEQKRVSGRVKEG